MLNVGWWWDPIHLTSIIQSNQSSTHSGSGVCRLLSWYVLMDGDKKRCRKMLRGVWLSSDGEKMMCVFPFFCGGGCGCHCGSVRKVSAVCEKMYIRLWLKWPKIMDDHGLGWWWGVWILVLVLTFLVDTFSRCVYVVCVACRLCGGILCSCKGRFDPELYIHTINCSTPLTRTLP
jgi:hypothetical protein